MATRNQGMVLLQNYIGYKPTVERGTNNLSLSTLNKYYQLFK